MEKVSAELAGEVLRLMIQNGVTLTGDLNPCERAVAASVRKVGAATIEAHLAGKKRLRRVESAVCLRGWATIRESPSPDGEYHPGVGNDPTSVLSLFEVPGVVNAV